VSDSWRGVGEQTLATASREGRGGGATAVARCIGWLWQCGVLVADRLGGSRTCV
jgi:hypothetical protein